jgi:FkbM family methyltransferase
MMKSALRGLLSRFRASARSVDLVPPPKHYYGLNDLDKKLEPYIDFDNGIFVEAGANDGQTQSNTAYFARHRGWRGLLVEPIPELAERCRAGRPESVVENCALVAFDADGQTVPMTYCGLMSVVDGGWSDPEAERAHVETGRQIQSLTTYRVDVPGKSLSSLLDKHNMTRVDLLSLDVEGFERQALEGLDLKRHRPRFILVEARFREQIDELLLPHYEAIAQLSHHDVLYRARKG